MGHSEEQAQFLTDAPSIGRRSTRAKREPRLSVIPQSVPRPDQVDLTTDSFLDEADHAQTIPESLATVRRRERIFRRALVCADALAAGLAVLAAFDLSGKYAVRAGYLWVVVLMVVLAKAQGLYDRDELLIRKSTLDELPRLVSLATLLAMLLWVSRHFIVIGAPGTETLVALWLLLLASIFIARVGARMIATRLAPAERCLFVGDAVTAERFRTKLAEAGKCQIVAAVVPEQLGHAEEAIRALISEFDLHRIIIQPTSDLPEANSLDLVRAAKATGLRVTLCPGVLTVVGSSVVFDDVWGMPLLGVRRFGLTRSSAVLKRGFDLTIILLASVVGLPLMALIALLIRLDSSGPVLFRQRRIGHGGRQFEILKFRTMVEGAEAMKAQLRAQIGTDGLFKIVDDPRVTRLGHWLRKSSLDELPQLFNVLRGEMSLVGPRPLVLDEDEQITGYHRRRLNVTPGMTGQWQILGSTRVPLHEMIMLDYLYLANWSLWTDIKILVRTVGVVATGRGV